MLYPGIALHSSLCIDNRPCYIERDDNGCYRWHHVMPAPRGAFAAARAANGEGVRDGR